MARIGIDASRANTTKRTGTEWYSLHVTRSIIRQSQQDHFTLYTKEAPLSDLQNLGSNVQQRTLTWPPKRMWTHTRFAWEMLTHPPDVLFVPAHTIPILHPRKTVTTAHDIGFERFPELYGPVERAYHRWSMKFAVNSAAAIITPSLFTKNELCDVYGIEPERISVIHHGFDRGSYRVLEDHAALSSVTARYGITKSYFLYIGRLEEKKNTPRLLEAFAAFKAESGADAQLLLVGRPGYGYERIRRLLVSLGIQSSVLLPGYVPQEDLPDLLNGALSFVFPSLYEGFGLTILEAQACGTPVITSSTTSLPEVAGDGAELVDPTKKEELAAALSRIYSDTTLRSSLREKGFKNLDRFSWADCGKQTLRVLKSVL